MRIGEDVDSTISISENLTEIVNVGELKRMERTQDNFDLQKGLREIEKMDALLTLKTAEREDAKLSRLQVEKESLNVLQKLINSGIPKAVEINLKAFEKLVHESDRTTTEDKRMDTGPESETGKKSEIQQPTKNTNFVRKNIELAKCGHGVLSITDSEKERITHLLEDVDVDDAGQIEEKEISAKNSWMTELSTLTKINEQLEIFGKSPHSSRRPPVFEMSTEDVQERVAEDAHPERGDQPREKQDDTSKNRLKQIDKSLDALNCPSHEVIKPLSTEEIELLIKTAEKGCQGDEGDASGSPGDLWSRTPTRETLVRLVSNAKSTMPKFNYRYNET